MYKMDWRACLAFPIGLVVADFMMPRMGIDRSLHPFWYGLAWGGIQLTIFLGIQFGPQWLASRKSPSE